MRLDRVYLSFNFLVIENRTFGESARFQVPKNGTLGNETMAQKRPRMSQISKIGLKPTQKFCDSKYHFLALENGHFRQKCPFFYLEFVSGRFDTSGSMVPRLVPEISSKCAFCDEAVAGIGDSRSLI